MKENRSSVTSQPLPESCLSYSVVTELRLRELDSNQRLLSIQSAAKKNEGDKRVTGLLHLAITGDSTLRPGRRYCY